MRGSDVFEMRDSVHRLMQHPQNADIIVFHPVKRRVPPDNHTAQSGQDKLAVGILPQVVREHARGTVKIVKKAGGLRLTPSGLRRNPDVDEVFLSRLGKTNFNHQGERGLRCGPLPYPAVRHPERHRPPAPPAAADLRASTRWPSDAQQATGSRAATCVACPWNDKEQGHQNQTVFRLSFLFKRLPLPG